MDFYKFIELLANLVTALGVLVLWHTIHSFNKTVRLSHYNHFDALYDDLLKLAIEKPHLREQNASRSSDQVKEYEHYAHLAWCMVETLYDHSLRDKKLLTTWESAIMIEANLHRDWLERPDNKYKFKKEFRNFIASEYSKERVARFIANPDAT